MADEKETLSAETQAKLKELDDLKGKFSAFEFVVDGKPQKLNLIDETETAKAKQFLGGGAKFSQNQAKLNAEREAFNKQKDEAARSVAEKVAGPGASESDIQNAEVTILAELEKDPDFKAGIEDGNTSLAAKAMAKQLAKIAAAKPAPAQGKPVDPADVRSTVSRQVAYETRIKVDPRFQLLAKNLGRGDAVAGAAMIAEQFKSADPEAADAPDFADRFLVFAHSWADSFGLKVEDKKPDERAEPAEPDKTTPPAGSQPDGSAGVGAETPKFKNPADVIAWQKEQDEKARKSGQRKHGWWETK
jgi:hypothetical protein